MLYLIKSGIVFKIKVAISAFILFSVFLTWKEVFRWKLYTYYGIILRSVFYFVFLRADEIMSRFIKLKKVFEPLLIIFITTALISFLYDFYYLLNETAKYETKRYLNEITVKSAKLFKEKINSDLLTVFVLSKYLGSFDTLDGQEAKAAMKKISNEVPFRSLLISNALNGTTYTGNGISIKTDHSEPFEGAQNRDQRVSQVLRDAFNGKDMVALTSPVYKNEKLTGSISGLYYTEDFIQIIEKISFQRLTYYQIIEKDGDLLFQNTSMETTGGFDNFYPFLGEVILDKGFISSIIINDIMKNKAGFMGYKFKDKGYYLSYAPIGINDWYLLAFAPKDSFNTHPGDIKKSALFMIIKIISLFLILILYIIWRQVKYKTVMEQGRIELEALNSKLKIRAENDLLTGLYNKITSELLISDYLETEGKNGRHALFVIDIDNFKNVNDEMGHLIGDRALIDTAAGINDSFRISDIKGRIGGDEFIVLLKNIASDEDIRKKAEDLCRLFKSIKVYNGQISGSVGAAVYPDHGTTYTELFEIADKAMYHSKELGKDGYYIYKINENI